MGQANDETNNSTEKSKQRSPSSQDGGLNLTGFVDHEVADVDLEERPSPRLVGSNSFMTKAQVTKAMKRKSFIEKGEEPNATLRLAKSFTRSSANLLKKVSSMSLLQKKNHSGRQAISTMPGTPPKN